MAYPIVEKPYGYQPVNLIGGQVYAGSTRNLPIQYNSTNPIFFGDMVYLNAGYVDRVTYPLSASAAANRTVGVFMGCYYTNPTTKQRQFAQYYPGAVLAGDITAIIADDPDIVIKTAVATTASSTIIGSASSLLVGSNMVGTTTLGSAATGNGTGGLVGASAAAASTAGFRVLSLVPDTQISNSATYVSGGAAAATSVVVSGLPVGLFIPIGTDVYNLVNGQLQYTGATVSTAATVTTTGSTTLTVTAIGTQGAQAATLVLVQTPEVLVKINFGVHNYNVA
jgi:hypothetical protein